MLKKAAPQFFLLLFHFTVHPKVDMLCNAVNSLEVENDLIATLPTEITEQIMSNLSDSKDIISFALTCKYTLAMIPRIRKKIVITDESVIKELLRSVEGRRVVSKLICCINTKNKGEKMRVF